MINPLKIFSVLLVSLLSVLPLFNCYQASERKVTPAFYHWKNTLNLSDKIYQQLHKLEVQKIYLRFFDIDWENGKAVPLSVLNKQTDIPDSIYIVPTVFITNRTMINTAGPDIPKLAEKIFKKLSRLSTEFKKEQIKEMQFDCDWSQQSREKYFHLLEILKSKLSSQGLKISATIRLHQIKYYQKTGIPNVDRGVLMFYNMDDIDQLETPNSIINISLAKTYLSELKHNPLTLDIALPIFKWGLVFQDGKMVKIINNLDSKELGDEEHFFKIQQNRFEVSKSTYLKGYYIYQKDQIKLEQVNIKTLREAADLLTENINNDDLNVIFYHLDSVQIADYSNEDLKNIYHRFH